MDGDLEDDDLLPDSLDLSYCCSAAMARGLNWQGVEDVDVEARRAFWMWYLNEAIPSALIIKQALQDRLPKNRRTAFGCESFYLDN